MADTTNEEIALEREWTKRDGPEHKDRSRARPTIWEHQDFPDQRRYDPPDFEHDWAHAGPLWGEMVSATGLLMATKWVSREIIYEGEWPTEAELMLATCRAWLAWKKEEKDV